MKLLPFLVFIIFFIIPAGGFLLLVFKLILKSKSSYWKGEVIDKVHNTKREEHNKIEHFYYLVVKTDERDDMKVGLSAEMYNSFQVGDIIEKPKGKLLPQKVN